jgi:hypothetical protein
MHNQWITTPTEHLPNAVTPTPQIDYPRPASNQSPRQTLTPRLLHQAHEEDNIPVKMVTNNIAIDTYLNLTQQRAIFTPNALQVLQHMRSMSNLLATAGTLAGPGGYAYLVESQEEWRRRLGDETAIRPGPLVNPTRPAANQSTGTWKSYQYAFEEYTEWRAIKDELLKGIQAKFPNMLAEVEDPEGLWLPADYMPEDAYTHILSHLLDRRRARELFLEVLRAMPVLTYTPCAIGPKVYFKDLMEYLYQARHLKQAGSIDINTVFTYALQAFRKCGHSNASITRLEEEWITKETELQQEHEQALLDAHAIAVLARDEIIVANDPDDDPRTDVPDMPPTPVVTHKDMTKDFVRFWTGSLARLYTDEPPTCKKASANQASIIEELQSQVETMTANHEILANAYNTLQQQPGPPSVITTDVSQASNLHQYQEAIAALTNEIRQLRNAPAPAPTRAANANTNGNGNGSPTTALQPRVQWNKYCYSCGVNLTHNTRDCKRTNKWDGHEDHLDCKFSDKVGNVGRNRLWNRYFDPKDKKGYATPTSST